MNKNCSGGFRPLRRVGLSVLPAPSSDFFRKGEQVYVQHFGKVNDIFSVPLCARRVIVRGAVAEGADFMRPIRQIRGDDMTRGQIVDFVFKVVPFGLKRFNGGFKRGAGHDGRGFVVAGAQAGDRFLKIGGNLFGNEIRSAFDVGGGTARVESLKRIMRGTVNNMPFQKYASSTDGTYPGADIRGRLGLGKKTERHLFVMTVRTFREGGYGNH